MITKKNRTRKDWVDSGTKFAANFKKLCKTEGMQNHSTISEAKAVFAERTTRSLKKVHCDTWKILDTITFRN